MPSKSTTSRPNPAAPPGPSAHLGPGLAARPEAGPGAGFGPELHTGLHLELGAPGEDREPTLAERLRPLVDDRGSTAERLVLEAAGCLHEHVLAQPVEWSWAAAGEELEAALAPLIDAHGWRGPVALWVDALRAAWHAGSARAEPTSVGRSDPGATARSLLRDELGLWLWGREEGCEELVSPTGPWDGRPFAPGRRLALREHAVARLVDPTGVALGGNVATDSNLATDTNLATDRHEEALRSLERGETILVPAHSETVLLALLAARRAGLAPEAIVPEGAPGLDGRRMARRLADAGVKVRYVYDAVLPALVPRADRIWLGTEAIGVEGFAARVGTRVLLTEAARLEVPALVVTTSDKLVPGGALELPAWGEREGWLLWEHAPAGVRLESQPYERVPHDLVAGLVTEEGFESAAALSLRRLRLEPAPPCGAVPAPAHRSPAELRGPHHEPDR